MQAAQLDLFTVGLIETPEEIFARVWRQRALRSRRFPRRLRVDLRFRRYANANSRISVADTRLEVRLSDLWADAPPEVLEALAEILVAKLLRKPVLDEFEALYRGWLDQPALRARLEHVKRTRGRKQHAGPRGGCYHLDELFDRLNTRYFEGRLRKPTLGWSRLSSRTLLGHYDPAHDTIVLNPVLDRPGIPLYAVEFILYHEMLHVLHPVEHRNGRRHVHTPAFRSAERQFDQYAAARDALKRICAHIN
jgi:hypothetical protein